MIVEVFVTKIDCFPIFFGLTIKEVEYVALVQSSYPSLSYSFLTPQNVNVVEVVPNYTKNNLDFINSNFKEYLRQCLGGCLLGLWHGVGRQFLEKTCLAVAF